MKRLIGRFSPYLLALFVFMIPWQTRWIWQEHPLSSGVWEYGRFSLYGTDILWVALFIAAVIIRQPLSQTVRRWSVTLTAFAAIAFVSAVASLHHDVSWYALIKLLQGMSLVWIVSVIPVRWALLSGAVIAAGTLQSVMAIVQFFTQSIPAHTWLGMAAHAPGILGDAVVETATGRFLRAYGSFPHPNILAGFLVVCLIVCIGALIRLHQQSKPSLRVILPTVIGFTVTFYGLILTFSRSAWLAMGVCVVGMLIHAVWFRASHRLKIMGSVVLWMVLVSVFCLTMFPELIQTRTVGGGRLEEMSATARLSLVDQTRVMTRDHWVSGVGIGGSTYAAYLYDRTRESWDYQPVHNLVLLIASEIGLIGGLLFVVIIGQFLWDVIRACGTAMRNSHVLYAFSFTVFSTVVIGFFEHYFWTLSSGIFLFWLIFGLWLRKYSHCSQGTD